MLLEAPDLARAALHRKIVRSATFDLAALAVVHVRRKPGVLNDSLGEETKSNRVRMR